MDFVSAPRDYAEFFTIYRPYVIGLLITKAGIDPQNAEDVASEIMLRFMERDFLPRFDPTLVFQYKGEMRPARFKSFLSKFVMKYAQGHRDRQNRIRSRELHMDDAVREDGNLWIEVFLPEPSADVDVLEELGEEHLAIWVRRQLARVPKRSTHDTCNLVALFDHVMIQIRRDGDYNITKLREIFHVSPTAMNTWMWWLKENMAIAMNRTVPAKRWKANPQ